MAPAGARVLLQPASGTWETRACVPGFRAATWAVADAFGSTELGVGHVAVGTRAKPVALDVAASPSLVASSNKAYSDMMVSRISSLSGLSLRRRRVTSQLGFREQQLTDMMKVEFVEDIITSDQDGAEYDDLDAGEEQSLVQEDEDEAEAIVSVFRVEPFFHEQLGHVGWALWAVQL
ncbi:hypothetical protein HK405_003387 [Cladochytrium tenue]|nr:hypothetical protein HK405_003387 [Cladochytrium tenue]